MKKIFLFTISLALICACNNQNHTFNIEADVPGLQKGDTLILEKIDMYDFDVMQIDTFFVSRDHYFRISDTISDAYHFLLMHKPLVPNQFSTSRRGLSLFIDNGHALSISAMNVDSLYAAHITGGFYNDSLVAAYSKINEDYDKENMRLYDRFIRARAAGNTSQDSLVLFLNDFNRHRAPSSLKERRKEIADHVNDSKFAAYLFIEDAKFEDNLSEILERYDRFTPDVKNSVIGKAVKRTLDIRSNLAVGANAPDFTLTDKNGNTVKLSDFAGKYLLMYHWGLCGGVIQIQPEVAAFYAKYHDKGLEILGTAEDDDITPLIENSSDPILASLLNASWPTVFTKNVGNEFLNETYMLQGTPMFTFISPEGKILAHGFHEAFYAAREIMSEQLR